MSSDYVFSATTLGFYPVELQEVYEQNGTWPGDALPVTNETYLEFLSPPEGKMRGALNGLPVWVDIPTPPNSELRKAALSVLSNTYQDDIEKLNRAWLAAAVNDGVNETAKKDVVLSQINARKTQYASDRAAIIAQYP
ncbi:tail fiber assembly protein [Enterobacter asburiae]|uniref:tail fiber assembly protein n=1 Tax=Enterobacter asburiae TaxID=61645 RepID=UPI0015E9544B|nr:tail assembly chaperone [Enterobacter asburiae]QLR28609.1 tail assembly chaperone [Enterobacter asburiae]HDR2644814.1 tail assembly chaperone [Enterobacter asburiae]